MHAYEAFLDDKHSLQLSSNKGNNEPKAAKMFFMPQVDYLVKIVPFKTSTQ